MHVITSYSIHYTKLYDLLAEDKIGTMLPCNIIVQDREDGKIEVAAINPVESMRAVENDRLGEIASTVQAKLKQVIENI